MLDQLADAHHRQPGRCQFDREWDSVESLTQRLDIGSVRLVDGKAAAHESTALDEQLDGGRLAKGWMGTTASPETPRLSRLVASTRTSGACRMICVTSWAASSMTCSQLSTTSSRCDPGVV